MCGTTNSHSSVRAVFCGKVLAQAGRTNRSKSNSCSDEASERRASDPGQVAGAALPSCPSSANEVPVLVRRGLGVPDIYDVAELLVREGVAGRNRRTDGSLETSPGIYVNSLFTLIQSLDGPERCGAVKRRSHPAECNDCHSSTPS
jgi:hypothetical protein